MRRSRGFTLFEVIFAAALTVFVAFAAISLQYAAMRGWRNGDQQLDLDSNAQRAVRTISAELRDALSVTIDADGLGLAYSLPAINGSGAITIPMVADGVVRRIELRNNTVRVTDGANTRVLARNVILTDPRSTGGTVAYRLFIPNGGTLSRSITVMVVTQGTQVGGGLKNSRSREIVYLRNLPEPTR